MAARVDPRLSGGARLSPLARTPAHPPPAALTAAPSPLAVRFGDLPIVERKATNKVVNKSLLSAFDHTHVCGAEVKEMLECFSKASWSTAACKPEIETMHACVDEHEHDAHPKLLAHRWQAQMRGQIFRHFASARLPPGLRR